MPENDNRVNGGGNEKAGKKKRLRAVPIIIVVLAAVTIIGFIGYFISWQSPPSAQYRNFVSYPTVSSSVSSSRDGKSHLIDIDLVVEYTGDDDEGISHETVYRNMSDTIGSLDYDDLRKPTSVEHIEAEVLKNLSEAAGEGKVSKVYVSNIAIDFPGEVNNAGQQGSGTSVNEKMKGLFPNLKD